MIADDLIVPGSYNRLNSIDECRPELQEFYRLWDRLRAGRKMPARRDFDPSKASHLLRHIILIDAFTAMPPERRYRVRLQGTAQVDYQGFDWTGYYLHEKAAPEAADRLCAVGDHIVATQEPWMSTGELYWMATKPFYRFESVLLPLSDDDAAVNMIFGLTIFF